MIGEVAAPEREAADPTTDWSFRDLAIAVALAAAAFVLRLQYFPRNGLFHDDAWAAASVSLTSPTRVVAHECRASGLHADAVAVAVGGARRADRSGLPGARRRRVGAGRRLRLPAGVGVRAEHQLRARGARGRRAGCHRALRPPEDVRHRSQHRRDPRRGAAPHRRRAAGARASRSCGSIGALALTTFSAFALIATAVAGVVLVVQANDDRRTRVIAIAAQLFLQLVYFYVISQTYNDRRLDAFWLSNGGYIDVRANPFAVAADSFAHLRGVVKTFPVGWGGGGWLRALVAIAAIARPRPRGGAPAGDGGRFLLLLLAVAAVASGLHLLPFGTSGDAYLGRLNLWLIPAIALGLAEMLRLGWRATATRRARPNHVQRCAVRVRDRHRRRELRRRPRELVRITHRNRVRRLAARAARPAGARAPQRLLVRHRDPVAGAAGAGCVVGIRFSARVRPPRHPVRELRCAGRARAAGATPTGSSCSPVSPGSLSSARRRRCLPRMVFAGFRPTVHLRFDRVQVTIYERR